MTTPRDSSIPLPEHPNKPIPIPKNKNTKEKITQARVKELFDFRNGNLIWRCGSGSAKAGSIAGCSLLKKQGRFQVCIDNKKYYNHRIVWLWVHGYLPENRIDHIDKNPLNNKIENLREVSQTCNMRNRKQQNSSSKIKGVSWCAKKEKWHAQICIGKKQIGLGRSVYFKNWKNFLLNPILGIEFIIYNFFKFGFGGMGYLMGKIKNI